MTLKRSFRHETLETRRLLAVDCLHPESSEMELPAAEVSSVAAGEPLVRRPVDALSPDSLAEHSLFDGALLADPSYYLEFIHGSDFVQQQGDRLIVLDQSSWHSNASRLLVFNQTDSGDFELQSETELSFRPDRMLVEGDRVMMMRSVWYDSPPPIHYLGGDDESFGLEPDGLFPPWPHFGQRTEIEVIHLGESISTSSAMIDGHVVQTDWSGNQLTLVTEVEQIFGVRGLPSIWPGPPTKEIHWLDVSSDSIEPIATQPLDGWSSVEFVGGDALVASRDRPTIDWSSLPDIDLFTAPEVDLSREGWIEDGTIRDGEAPLSSNVMLTRYSIRDGEVVQVGQLDLGEGALPSLHVSADGLTAFTMADSHAQRQPQLTLHLLDLGESGPSIFETIEQSNFRGNLLAANSQHVVLQNFNDNSIYIINADQSTDQASTDRVQIVPLDHELGWVSVLGNSAVIDPASDTLLLDVTRVVKHEENLDGATDEDITETSERASYHWTPVSHDRVILTLSLSEAQVIAESPLPEQFDPFLFEQWYEIDSASQRFGYLARQPRELPDDDDSETGDSETSEEDGMERANEIDEPDSYYGLGRVGMAFGRFNDDGQFVQEGFVALQRAREIDVDADRLLVRTEDSLIEYDWDNPSDPTTTELPNRKPDLTPVDDIYDVWDDGQAYLLDVLANDQLLNHWVPWLVERPPHLEIVELVGAPEGVEIVDGQFVRVSGDLMASSERLEFAYVVSNGTETATANVNLTIQHVTQEAIDRLTEAVRVRGAEDLGLSLDEVTVVSVRQLWDRVERRYPAPIEPSYNVSDSYSPDAAHLTIADPSPQLRVELEIPRGRALYGATLSGSIFQISVHQDEEPEGTDPIISMSVQAVDSAGVAIQRLEVGQEFTLEVLAEDLRSDGGGVYSAFFDMLLRGEGIELTGEHETGDEFQFITDGEIGTHEVDEFGAVSVHYESPGNVGAQVVYRFRARATAVGEQLISLNAADHSTSENTVYGRDTQVGANRTEFGSLTLIVDEPSERFATDVNRSGEVSALDALMVINFLSEYGSGQISELAEVVSESDTMAGSDGSPSIVDDAMRSMERFDVNRSGSITVLDALVVINRLNRVEPVALQGTLSTDISSNHDEDDDERRGQLF